MRMWRWVFVGMFCVMLMLGAWSTGRADEVVFTDGFELGLANWEVDNGVWDFGAEPMAGPGAPHSGFFCAGTVVNGSYPGGTNSRLISPQIVLPGVIGDEEIYLRFWHWFSYSDDSGVVQVRVYDEDTGVPSGWTDVPNTPTVNDYSDWTIKGVDLTSYAGRRIQIAFYHRAGTYNHAAGWYLDDLVVIKKVPETTWNFETGWGDWYADRGVWQIGVPTGGPGAAYEGTQCSATFLSGYYPADTDSRLISPSFRLSSIHSDEEIHLRFWHWFSYSDDSGVIQISVYNEDTGWSSWANLPNTPATVDYSYWTVKDVDLTRYAGEKIRLAFYHVSGAYNYASGWYIDSIEIITKIPELSWDFECGWGDWHAENGVWGIGTPTSGPSYVYSGIGCAAPNLNGNYPASTDSRLVSPTIVLPSSTPLYLSFYHWYSYSDDSGYVQISELDENTMVWGSWINLSSSISGVSSIWSKYPDINISAYAGKHVRIAFYHISGTYNYASGWYIDKVRITGFQGFCECDLNQDGRCDMRDWLVFGQRWGATNCATVPCACDLSHDGRCDMVDWLRFGESWGRTNCPLCQ